MSRQVPRHIVVLTAVLALLLGSGLAVAAAASTGAISGTLTVPTGSFTDVCVSAHDRGDANRAYGTYAVDDQGRYAITGLQTGSYRVKFAPCVRDALATQWFAGATDLQSATPVAVTDGVESAGVDAAMTLTGSVAGTVTGEAAAPLPDLCVQASGMTAGAVRTAADGRYSISGLAPGGHDLVVGHCYEGDGDYATSTTLVTVTEGGTTTADVPLQLKGEIAGIVKDEAGAPIAGICVAAARGYHVGQPTKTDVTGAYRLRGLEDGDYAVRYDDCSGGDYSTEWWQDASRQQDATLLSAAVGTTLTADAQLQAGGRIVGRLQLAGKAAGGACVTVWRGNEQQLQMTTALDGSFTTSSLAAGSYTLRFDPCGPGPEFPSQWHGGTQGWDPSSAAPVLVGTGTSDLGVVGLVQPGSLSGTLTSAGLPASDVCVSASREAGPGGGNTSTGQDGSYRMDDLWPGSYTVRLANCEGPYLAQELTGITVNAAGNTVVDGVLKQGSKIMGRVTDDTGAAVAGACVNAEGPSFRSAYTGADGTYSIAIGAPGDYLVSFHPCEGPRFVHELYDDERSPQTAERVTVAADQVVVGIDAQVQRTATLSGRVLSDTGEPLPGTCVTAHGDYHGGSTTTGPTGSYEISGMAPGTYVIRFSDCGGGIIGEYFSDAAEQRDARPIALAPGESKTLADASVTPASSLTGTLTREHDGAPAIGACVLATDRFGVVLGEATAGADGTYRIGGLVAGSYRVSAGDCYDGRYVTEWFTDAATPEAATPISLGSATNRPGVDMTLAARGRVAGQVIDGEGVGIAGICVSATSSAGEERPLGVTRISGRYTSPYLDVTDYKIAFKDCSAPLMYQDEWYDNATSAAGAGGVTVLAAADVMVNAVLGGRVETPVTGSEPTTSPTAPATTPAAPGGGSVGFPAPAAPSVPTVEPSPTPTVPPVTTPTPPTTPPTASPDTPPVEPVDGGQLPPAGQQAEVPLQPGTPDAPSAVQVGPLTVFNTGEQAELVVERTTLEQGTASDVAVLGLVLDISPAGGVVDGQLVVCLQPDLSAYPEGSPFRETVALWHLTSEGQLVDESASYDGGLTPDGAVCGAPNSFSPFFAGSLPTAADVADVCAGVAAAGYADVAADSVHRAAIDCAAWWSLTLGVTPTSYGPEKEVTRGQMASFLTRLAARAGADLPVGPDAFADDRGSVHERSINRLAAAGIVRGASSGGYEPGAVVSRAQMASFLVRTYEHVASSALPIGSHDFVDADVPAHGDEIAKAVTAGFTNGRTATSYAPAEPVRRDQMASFLTRVLRVAAAPR